MKMIRRSFLKIAAVAAVGWGVRPASDLLASGDNEDKGLLFTSQHAVLTIPTMIVGLFGMNVLVPGANDPLMFWKITVVSIVAACALGGFFLRKR